MLGTTRRRSAVVRHQCVRGAAEGDHRDRTGRLAVTDILFEEIESRGRHRREHVGRVAREVVGHAAAHREAGGVDPLGIDAGHHADLRHQSPGEGDVVDVRHAARADVPGRRPADP